METYTDTLPRFWWLRPWRHARRLHAAVISYRDHCTQVWKWHDEHKAEREKLDNMIKEVAKEHGFIPANALGQDRQPVRWLGNAVAYWQGEAKSAREERDALKAKAEADAKNPWHKDCEISGLRKHALEQEHLLYEKVQTINKLEKKVKALEAKAKPAKKKGGRRA